MTERIIDLSEGPVHLCFRNDLLVIERDGTEVASVPLVEIGAVVAAQARVTFTQSALAGLALAGVSVVVCDERFLPAGMLLPVQGNFVQGERFVRQARASLPLRKRLWQQIVQAKIKAQAHLLQELHSDDFGLLKMATRVRTGDADNHEAQAAAKYWHLLFADEEFRRDPDRQDQNRLLNYGYAILRASTARAICAAGLHPSLGLHHHNRYDTFCLADDLMEPFRPRVDSAVVGLIKLHGTGAALDRDTKAALIEEITGRFGIEGESRTLFDVLSRVASSLDDVFAGTRRKLLLPDS